jgi:secondary thiamine-phosphate synthase enzyme
MVIQIEIEMPGFKRGFHLITRQLLEKLPPLPLTGIIHIHIKHTSAALTLNENADPTVRADFESVFNHIVPENQPYYFHNLEGSDDLPAHIKSSMLGNSVTIPISNGKLNLGTWQGIYLCEFRNYGGPRNMVITILGE